MQCRIVGNGVFKVGSMPNEHKRHRTVTRGVGKVEQVRNDAGGICTADIRVRCKSKMQVCFMFVIRCDAGKVQIEYADVQ